jgi:pyruvate dehydrogenase E2 component (dihydrolipoamide acetyltransferase)
MPAEIYLVKVGMTMTEGMVEEWYIPDGARVEKGQLLYRLETEKVNLDVDAETTGTVKHVVGVGVTMKPGDVIGYIYAPGEAVPATASAPTPVLTPAPVATPVGASSRSRRADVPIEAPAIRERELAPTGRGDRVLASPAARRLARELGIDHTALAGSGPGGRIVEADVRAAADATTPSVTRASPLAKRIAAELGVDLGRVRGTGPGGRITRDDVEAAAKAPRAAAPVAAAAIRPVPAGPAAGTRIPLKGMRRTIATRMKASLAESAQLTMDMDVVMDDAVRMREQLVAEWEPEGIRPTYTDIVIRAAAKALRVHPLMNSVFGESEITLLDEIHIGIAVAVEEGLVVPVLRNVAERSLKEIAVESAALARKTREGKLALDDMSGGTFTVTALGMFGVDSFTPILNAPQSGILGVNRIRDDVGWDGDRPVKQKRMCLSLTWDHRALDGAPAARFLGTVRDLLESPYRLLV